VHPTFLYLTLEDNGRWLDKYEEAWIQGDKIMNCSNIFLKN
jgi:hypothetical protein